MAASTIIVISSSSSEKAVRVSFALLSRNSDSTYPRKAYLESMAFMPKTLSSSWRVTALPFAPRYNAFTLRSSSEMLFGSRKQWIVNVSEIESTENVKSLSRS
ncbi:MAG: hypothetical protein AAB250_19135, partial [Bdellovibrionota bacterium]